MPLYSYTAVNSSGKIIKGKREGVSVADIKKILETDGFSPLEVNESTGAKAKQGARAKVRFNHLSIFTRQLSVLIRSGLPILESLGICSRQSQCEKLSKILNSIQEHIRNGKSLSQSMKLYPTVFSNLYCSLVKAGEETGALDSVLDQLSKMLIYEYEVKKEVKGALRYPMGVLFTLIIAFFIVITFVIPKLTATFSKAGVKLPLPTRMCIGLNELIRNHWFLSTLTVIGIIAAFIWLKKTEKGKFLYDSTILKIPYFGTLVTQSTMFRFSYIYSTLCKSGISVLKSMEILSDVVDNVAISRNFISIKNGIEEGATVSTMIKRSPFFTEMTASMIAVGERTGDMERLLAETADYYDAETKYAIKKLTDILPIVLTILMAIMVGFFVMAIYLPLFELSKVAGGLH